MACNRPSTSSTKLEITHACHEWFELGFHVFTSADTRLAGNGRKPYPPASRSSEVVELACRHQPQSLVPRPTKVVNAAFEYYGSVGPINDFVPFRFQEQQFFPAIDLNLSPKWEYNFGVGVGVTQGTDHLIVKMIIGYRFDL